MQHSLPAAVVEVPAHSAPVARNSKSVQSDASISTSVSNLKPAAKPSKMHSSSSSDEEDVVEEAVVANSTMWEQHSYDQNFAIMPRFKPIAEWNKDVDDDRTVIDIFASANE